MSDPHESRERYVFDSFCSAAGLPVEPGSITKRPPPEPDIRANLRGRGPVAFELVEIVDAGIAQDLSDDLKLRRRAHELLAELPREHRDRIQGVIGNALVHVRFPTTFSLRQRTESLPALLCELEGLEPAFQGSRASSIDNTRLTIYRGEFTGPCFDFGEGGSFGDPTLAQIVKKLQGSYQSSAPAELLAYYELQPVLPLSHWEPHLAAVLEGNLSMSSFQRVWVYDVRTKRIVFVHPSDHGVSCDAS